MSEKHLTELAWKTLVVKQGVKDIGLGKALSAYSNAEAQEPAKALESLKTIAELALKLKKANSAKEEVVAHLDEVVKEVKKTTPGLEARVKAGAAATVADAKTPAAGKPEKDEADDEKAAEAFKKDLKNQMVSALAQVKMRAPGDPDQEKEPKPQLKFMAYLAAKGSAVVVALRVGAATKKLLPDIAGVASGGKFVQGECLFEKNAITFVLEQIPGGLAKKLSAALHAETGQKYKVRARNTDGSVTLDSDTDVDPDTATAWKDPTAQWKTKLAEWTPAIKEALAAKGPNAASMAKLYIQATTLAKPGGDMAQALAKLTECHALMTSSTQGGGKGGGPGKVISNAFKAVRKKFERPPPPQPVPRTEIGTDQMERAKKLLSKMSEADQKRVNALLKQANDSQKKYLYKALSSQNKASQLEAFFGEISDKDDTWMEENLHVVGNSEGKGIKQQWQCSCGPTTIQALRGEMDPIYALKLHKENPNLAKADNKDATKLNPSMAQEQKDMLEFGNGKATARNKDGEGLGLQGALDRTSVKEYLGLSFDSVSADAGYDPLLSDLDQALASGLPVPARVGRKGEDSGHFVLITGGDGGQPRRYSIHDPWEGKTITIDEDKIKSKKLNVAGWPELTDIFKPSVIKPT